MKSNRTSTRILLICAVTFALVPVVYSEGAQQPNGWRRDPEHPGITYSIEVLRRGEEQVTVVEDPRRFDFRTGDRLRLRLVPNFTGFAYVLEVRDGEVSLVYPPETGGKRVEAGSETAVPAQGWMRLVSPAKPFTMRVLFRPEKVEAPRRPPRHGSIVAQADLAAAVLESWQALEGSKGMMFESGGGVEPPAERDAPGVAAAAGVRDPRSATGYVFVANPENPRQEPAIAVEIPIRHVLR